MRTRINDLSQRSAAAFLRTFFAPRQVAEIKRLEESLWDAWKTDPGRVLRRCGYSLREDPVGGREILWKLFFVKELRFKLVDGWRRRPESRRFESTVKRYSAYRLRLARLLNPDGARIRVEGEDCLLKTALSPIEL